MIASESGPDRIIFPYLETDSTTTSARPCPACRHSRSRPHFVLQDRLFRQATGDFPYRKCERCGSLFISPLPSAGRIATFYHENYWWQPDSGASSWLQKREDDYRRRVVRDHLRFLKGLSPSLPSHPTRLLDIGCGSGSFLSEARRQGFWVTGMDSSTIALECLRRLDIPSVSPPMDRVSIDGDKFDILTLFHVLEHFENPSAELKSLLRWARPGATLIAQVPLVESLQARLFGPSWYGLDPPRHLTQFTLAGLSLLLAGAGLKIEKVWHFSLRDNAPAMVSSLFPRLDPMARRVRQSSKKRPPSLCWETLLRLFYFLSVLAATPPAWAEAAIGRGGTVIVRARVPEKESGEL